MAGYWLKLYTEILDDPKYYRLSDNAKLGMYELMLVAKKIDKDGYLPSVEDICFYTRREQDWWESVIGELQNIDFLVVEEEGILIRRFLERQMAVDPAERRRLSRELKNKETFSHDSVTNLSRNVTTPVTKRDNTCHESVTNLSRNVTEHVTNLSRNVTERRDRERDRERERGREETEAETRGGTTNDNKTDSGVHPVQRMIETITGIMPTNPSDIQALDTIVEMQPTEDDIRGAADWVHSQGRRILHYSTLIGPVRTAIAQRVQGNPEKIPPDDDFSKAVREAYAKEGVNK